MSTTETAAPDLVGTVADTGADAAYPDAVATRCTPPGGTWEN